MAAESRNQAGKSEDSAHMPGLTPSPHVQNKTQKSGLTKAGTLTPFSCLFK
jgi:hypothetical protein